MQRKTVTTKIAKEIISEIVAISEGYTTIGHDAFNYELKIQEVILPAGIEIKLLTIGINLQKKTVLAPLVSNHLSAISISFFLSLKILPILPETILINLSLFKIFPIK